MDLPKREIIRLPEYDYAQCGVYFLTLCVKDRHNVFWSVGATCVRPLEERPLSDAGRMVANEIEKIHTIYSSVSVDQSCVMPDHIHLLLVIQAASTVSRVVQQFKGVISKRLGRSIWQKSFYDHIIRNKADYIACWEYIEQNPVKWKKRDL